MYSHTPSSHSNLSQSEEMLWELQPHYCSNISSMAPQSFYDILEDKTCLLILVHPKLENQMEYFLIN